MIIYKLTIYYYYMILQFACTALYANIIYSPSTTTRILKIHKIT